jgi:acyl carrier protein
LGARAGTEIRGEGVSSYQFLSEVLVEKYNVAAAAVHPEATMAELGLDSLSLTELLFDLEDEYGIEVPDERARFNTLAEAAALVDELIRAKTA